MVSSSSGETIAALDIGTNSFHLVIAKPVAGGFEVVTREKQSVRIGHGAGEMKLLEPDAIDRG
ncbi:MAG: exopolyphosphatase, partial [Actinomycetota bacterium]